MKDDELISRLLRRHPHFQNWAAGLFRGEPDLTTLQFAVVDAYGVGMNRFDVSDLYMRLQMEVAIRVSRDGRSLRIPTLREFERIARLHLPMVCNVPWRIMDRQPRGCGPSGLHGSMT